MWHCFKTSPGRTPTHTRMFKPTQSLEKRHYFYSLEHPNNWNKELM